MESQTKLKIMIKTNSYNNLSAGLDRLILDCERDTILNFFFILS